MTDEGFAAINDSLGSDSNAETRIGVRFRANSDAAIASLQHSLGSTASVTATLIPPELSNLRFVKTLPTVLAIFLAVIGVAAVGHVLFVSVRRRARDFAVLRALGVTRPGLRMIIGSYATAIAIAGVVIGIPIGIALGRSGWHSIAQRVPLQFVSPTSALLLLLLLPLAILAANLLAIIPGWRAVRLQPSRVLRDE